MLAVWRTRIDPGLYNGWTHCKILNRSFPETSMPTGDIMIKEAKSGD